MKKLLSLLTTIGMVITSVSGVTNSIFNSATTIDVVNRKPIQIPMTKIEQPTIYIDKDGNEKTTNEKNLFNLQTNKIIQIGFYTIESGVKAVRMPKTITEVPKLLPKEITLLNEIFRDTESFNQDLSSWDTSNITNMSGMFMSSIAYPSNHFNHDINNWNVSSVTDMSFMFYNSLFNQDISKWDTKNVIDMTEMFSDTLFNQDLSNWNTSNVRNMSGMFKGQFENKKNPFNGDIRNWNTENVTDMTEMFQLNGAFNHNISNWNVGNVTEYNNFNNKSILSRSNSPKFIKAKDKISVNYNFYDSYYTSSKDDSPNIKVLNWTNYADSWSEFKEKYTSFNVYGLFQAGITISQSSWGVVTDKWILHSENIGNYSSPETVSLDYEKSSSIFTRLTIDFWHDDQFIWFQWHGRFKGDLRNYIGVRMDYIDIIQYA